MSNRKFSPEAFRIALRADRSFIPGEMFDWVRVASTDTMIGQNRCHSKGRLLGYTFLEDGKTRTAVFVPGAEPSVVSVGDFPMSPIGERGARAAVEASLLAAKAA